MFGKIFATMNKIPSEIDAGWSSGPQSLTTAGKPRNSLKIFAGSFPKFLSSNVWTNHRTSTEYRYSRIIFWQKTVLFIYIHYRWKQRFKLNSFRQLIQRNFRLQYYLVFSPTAGRIQYIVVKRTLINLSTEKKHNMIRILRKHF